MQFQSFSIPYFCFQFFFCVFLSQTVEEPSFSAFHIATAKITHFESGKALERFLASQKLSTPEWKDLKTLYDERWKLANQVRQNPALGFWTQRKNSYGLRFPLKMPWQVILTDSNVYIGKYDPQQSFSKRKSPLEWKKVIENIALIHYGRTFAAFKQKDGEKPEVIRRRSVLRSGLRF